MSLTGSLNHPIRRTRMACKRKTPEGAIKTSIAAYLEHYERNNPTFFYTLLPSVGVYDPVNKRFRKPSPHQKPGMPDILCLLNGIAIGLEVKAPKGRISATQKDRKSDFERCGHVYEIVYSVEDTIRVLNQVICGVTLA